MKDQYGRIIDYMRISITDKCNLRCRYCMPEGVEIIPMSHLLTFEEIVKVCTAAAELGVRKLKVTGGEPLVRRGAPALFGMLREIHGIEDVTLTTNGVLLKKYLPALMDNGLRSVNISLDTMDRTLYEKITGQDAFLQVMESIETAVDAGLQVKINTVLLEGVNDNGWEQMLLYAGEHSVDVRFIEIMPIGAGSTFTGVSNQTLLARIRERYPDLTEDLSVHGNGPASYYSIPGFAGGVGFISAMHGKFCDHCNRIRMSAQGEIKPCLCYGTSVDLRQALRGSDPDGEENRTIRENKTIGNAGRLTGKSLSIENNSDRKNELKSLLARAIWDKPQAHCFERRDAITEDKKMVSIGG